MAEPRAGQAFAAVCDDGGRVERVICPAADAPGVPSPGQALHQLVAGADESVEGFLAALRARQVVLDWPLDRAAGTGLWLSGARLEGCLVVLVSPAASDSGRVAAELVRMNNEQANALRDLSQRLAQQAQAQARDDDASYEALTRVNNELVNTQRALAQANAGLERLNRRKNELLGMAAHDLRSPLGTIQTYSEFLESEAGERLTPEQLEFLDVIRSSSAFMLRVVDNLLDLASIEAGQLVLDPRTEDLEAQVRGLLQRQRPLAARKSIALELAVLTPIPPFPFDRDKVEQALSNLLDNAVKFSHPGGTVTVTLDDDGQQAVVEVADRGIGMAEEARAGLFIPYGVRRTPGTRGEKSVGLGLAIVKRIVEGHGGAVTVTSRPGHGTIFRITLPRGTAH